MLVLPIKKHKNARKVKGASNVPSDQCLSCLLHEWHTSLSKFESSRLAEHMPKDSFYHGKLFFIIQCQHIAGPPF